MLDGCRKMLATSSPNRVGVHGCFVDADPPRGFTTYAAVWWPEHDIPGSGCELAPEATALSFVFYLPFAWLTFAP